MPVRIIKMITPSTQKLNGQPLLDNANFIEIEEHLSLPPLSGKAGQVHITNMNLCKALANNDKLYGCALAFKCKMKARLLLHNNIILYGCALAFLCKHEGKAS